MGVQHILALSPEAKGRVERANGTFQDRLVAELRLAGAKTLREANHVLQEFLTRFNARFAVPAAQPESAYRPLAPEMDLAGIICFKERRMVARDNTVTYRGSTLQLLPGNGGLSHAGVLVEVQERLDGNLVVCVHGGIVPTQNAPARAAGLRRPTAPRVDHNHIAAHLLLNQATPQGADGRRSFSPWDDYAYKNFHRELIRAGMARVKKLGKHLGRPRVQDREGFALRLKDVSMRMQSGEISRREAALELGIGYTTLKRLLDKAPQSEQNMVTDKIL